MSTEAISAKALAERHIAGKKIDLIDVRTPVEFREMHVEFAHNIPLDRLDPDAFMAARNNAEGRTSLHSLPFRRQRSQSLREVSERRIHQRHQRRGRNHGL